jgi:hypothetical protein
MVIIGGKPTDYDQRGSSLLSVGYFCLHIPLIYGEGLENASIRFGEEIGKRRGIKRIRHYCIS